jgi:hypothetical protein
MLTASTPCYGYGGDGRGAGLGWCSIQPHWEPASVTAPEVMNATLKELHEVAWRAQPYPRSGNATRPFQSR